MTRTRQTKGSTSSKSSAFGSVFHAIGNKNAEYKFLKITTFPLMLLY